MVFEPSRPQAVLLVEIVAINFKMYVLTSKRDHYVCLAMASFDWTAMSEREPQRDSVVFTGEVVTRTRGTQQTTDERHM
jgi:hypothetical protein